MYNAETLLDVHARAHESLRRLIVFCGNLTDDELRRPLTGFGFSTSWPSSNIRSVQRFTGKPS